MTPINKFVNGKPVTTNTNNNNGGEKPLEPKMITVRCVYKSFNFNLTINEERQKELGVDPVRSCTITLGEALSLGEKAFLALSAKALEVGKAKETKAQEEAKVKAEEKAKEEEAKAAQKAKLEAAIALFKEAGIVITKEMIAGKPKPQPKVETESKAKPQTEPKAKPQASIKDGAVKYLKACVQGKATLPQKGQVKTLMEDLTGLTWSSQTAEGIRLSHEEGVVYISFETGFYKAHEETCHTAFQAVRESLRFTGLEYKKMDKGRLPITFRAL